VFNELCYQKRRQRDNDSSPKAIICSLLVLECSLIPSGSQGEISQSLIYPT